MKRSPIIPFFIIMVVGVIAVFLISFKGLGDSKDLAAELEGSKGEKPKQVAASPEEFYKQNCMTCHGDQYQGGVGPSLKGVNKRLTNKEIQDVIVNGRNAMPSGLVPADKAEEMAKWLSKL